MTNIPLPLPFIERMQNLLGNEADTFLAALGRAALTGLRTNTLKLSAERLRALAPWSMTPTPWCPDGFVVSGREQPGKHPFHAAGLYYMQEPSAMAVAVALAPQPGELVLDLAAAPGGKATHLAALMYDWGIVVANEIETSRTSALSSNIERWGIRQAIITNAEPERLASQWGAIFDRVLLDAPCSGEGMFRKSATAIAMWRPEMVQGCALRQQRALDTAAALVRPGGMLCYSTCTFAPEENEQVIAAFLDTHRDFELAPTGIIGAAPACPDWLATPHNRSDLTLAARLWPHRTPGEGHFVALLQRAAGEAARLKPAAWKPAPQPALALWRDFVAATFTSDPFANTLLVAVGQQLYAIPEGAPHLDGLKVKRAGVCLGTIHPKRFEPAHSLALALQTSDLHNVATFDLAPDDERLDRYLQGHPLPEPGADGWMLLSVTGFPVSWGRRSRGIIKNVYPKGLRRPLR
ncbi:MAG: RsmF rRNA methyltransferase first C-terminal domain-containing protein [Chloroflexales bacterium]|nr:RsmF rRNA methyltransferase first C-terminal domain-containing protein [Chloroflexales bacterium]